MKPLMNTSNSFLVICLVWFLSINLGAQAPGSNNQVIINRDGAFGSAQVATDSTGNNLTIPGIADAAFKLNTAYRVSTPGVVATQSAIDNANNFFGRVSIDPSVASMVGNTMTVVTASVSSSTGGHLGVGRYFWKVCPVNAAGIEWRPCGYTSPQSGLVISSSSTNIASFNIGAITGDVSFNIYGRTTGEYRFIKSATTVATRVDDGSMTPTTPQVASFSNAGDVSVDDERYGVMRYRTGVPVSNYCSYDVEFGGNDATDCIQQAVNDMKTNGFSKLDFTNGATYIIASSRGFMQGPGDDGTCPSGATVNGAPCTTLAPDYTMQAYSIDLGNGNMTLNLNGATLQGKYTNFVNGLPATPAMFACTQGCNNLVIDGGSNFTNSNKGVIRNTFIALFTSSLFFSQIKNVNFGACGFPFISQTWDSSAMEDNTWSCEAGPHVGGWYISRYNVGFPIPSLTQSGGGYADGLLLNKNRANGNGIFSANGTGNVPNTDSYFWNYIYRGPNETNGRMVDRFGTSSPTPGWNETVPFFGSFGQGFAVYGRYGRQNNGWNISDFQTKALARSPVVANAPVVVGQVLNVGAEGNAGCGTGFVNDANCPDPYAQQAAGLLNRGYINATLQNMFILSISKVSGYANPVWNASQSTFLGMSQPVGSTNPGSQIYLRSGLNSTSTVEPVSGQIVWSDILNDPNSGFPGGPTQQYKALVHQNRNSTAHLGAYWQLGHPTDALTPLVNYWQRFDSVQLSPMPATGDCYAPTAGPPPDSGTLGMFRYVPGTGGAADSIVSCYKNADGTNTWHTFREVITGRATLVAGAVTVSNPAVSATPSITLSNCGTSGAVGILSLGTVTAGASFVINSSSNADTSTVCWTLTR